MGAAFPWRWYCKEFGSRQNWLNSIYAVWTLQTQTADYCFEIQPITVTPNQLKQGSYDQQPLTDPNMQSYNIWDDSIVAVQSNGQPYPSYQVVPYEGCGGNCQNFKDCFNDCFAQGNAGNNAINCDFGAITPLPAQCNSM